MSEIKFRQFIGGRMVYWGFLGGAFFGPSANGATGENPQNTPQMQYTGLHDKNGKDVFEGDILLYVVKASKKQGRAKEQRHYWEVYFDRGQWRMKRGEQQQALFDKVSTHKLIGNIYENPELLK